MQKTYDRERAADMIYLSQFTFPSIAAEERYLHEIKETCFTTVYPFQVLTEHEVHTLNFDESVTVLYGGNGSGKTTALNVIAEKLQLERDKFLWGFCRIL